MHLACTDVPVETTLHLRDRCLCLQQLFGNIGKFSNPL
jgi:hypothetical protein